MNETQNMPGLKRFCEFGPLAFDIYRNRVFLKDVELSFTEEEFSFVYLLAQNEGSYLTFEQLYASIWGEDSAAEPGTARLCMDNAAERINTTESVVMIDSKLEAGYLLRLTGAEK